MAALRYVVLDFDGTCTQIERVQGAFLDAYRAAIGAEETAWLAALATVRAASPTAGWTLLGAPATAPAGADPYILAGEAAALLLRQGVIAAPPAPDLFKKIYDAHPAPFRPELPDVLAALAKKRIHIGFISNSDSRAIQTRLGDLLTRQGGLRDRIHVTGNAAKFLLREIPVGASAHAIAPHRARFEALPAAAPPPPTAAGPRRPLYLRRGGYFEALCAFYAHAGDATFPIERTLVCGDIWELDLALPAALGAQVHLIERAEPYATYDYERAALASPKHISRDLRGLLKRL